jgi:hypothetical protein
MTRHRWRVIAVVVSVIATLAYLYDPSWIGGVTSGMRPWEEDPPGTFFRWTNGRATFFIPSKTSTMTLPLRAVFPGPNGGPTTVDISVDDRFLATIELPDPNAWVRTTLPLGPARSRRRFRRIDLRTNRVTPPMILGVMTGKPELQ